MTLTRSQPFPDDLCPPLSTCANLLSTDCIAIEGEKVCARCGILDLDKLVNSLAANLPSDDQSHKFEAVLDLGILTEEHERSICPLCRLFFFCRYRGPFKSHPNTFTLFRCSSTALDNPELTVAKFPPGIVLAVLPTRNYFGHQYLGCINFIFPISSKLQHTHNFCQIQQSVDYQLPKSWIEHCKKMHHKCSSRQPPRPSNSHFFVDCNSRQVVPAQESEYAALSYMWGDSASSAGLIASPGVTGALPSILPKVIEDAILATVALGYRYLWVDRYCISAKDPSLKHKQIAQMDQIYKNAEVTLFAVAGNPLRGLPGVNKTTRVPQMSANVGGYCFLSTLRDSRRLIQSSEWHTRGWTLQEAVLSKRRLFFTDEQIYFECMSSHQCEVLDKPDDQDTIRAHRFLPNSRSGPLYNWITTYDIDELWQGIIRYNIRRLTYQSDALNAFLGIFRVYEDHHQPIRHYCGIPFSRPEEAVLRAHEKYRSVLVSFPSPPAEVVPTIQRRDVQPTSQITQQLTALLASLRLQTDEALKIGEAERRAWAEMTLDERSRTRNGHPARFLSSEFAAGLFWTAYSKFNRRPEFPSWTWAGWHSRDQINPPKMDVTTRNQPVEVWVEFSDHTLKTFEEFYLAGGLDILGSMLTPYIHILAWVLPMILAPMSGEILATLEDKNQYGPLREQEVYAEFLTSEGKPEQGVPFLLSNPDFKKSSTSSLEIPVIAVLFFDPNANSPPTGKPTAYYALILEERGGYTERIGSMGIVSDYSASMGPHYGTYRAVCKERLPWTERRIRLG